MTVASRLKRMVFPLRLSEALTVVNELNRRNNKLPHWFNIPIKSVESCLGDVPITDITPADIVRWYEHLRCVPSKRNPEEKLSAWTVDSYARAVKSFFNHLVRAGHLEESPAKSLRLPKLPRKSKREITGDELRRMVRHSERNRRDHAIVLILRDSGCRVGELCSMCTTTVHLKKHKKRWAGRALVLGKGNKQRYIYYGHKACKALRRYLRIRPNTEQGAIWLSRSGSPLTPSGVYQMLKRLGKYAGVDHFNPHAFRHALAKRLVHAGAPHKAIQEILGHEDITTTLSMYVTYNEEEVQDLHREFNPYG